MSMFHELMMKKKGIPSRYQEVEWIDPNTNAYINTGYYLQSNNLKIKTKVTYDFSNTAERDFIGNQDNTTNRFVFGQYQKYWFAYSKGTSSDANVTSATFTGTQTQEIEVNYNFDNQEKSITVDGNTTTTAFNNNIYPSNNPIQIFASGTASGIFIGKVYYLQLFENNKMIFNFVPVYDTLTQKYGMWESVQGKFYGNDGTGDFKGSIVGYTVVGSPTIVDGVVSGFSASDYLSLTKALTVTNTMDIEIYVRAKMPSTISSGFNFVYNNTSGYLTYFYLGTYSNAVFTASLQTSILKFSDIYITVQTETWYRFKITGKDGIWKFEIYDDNGNLLKEQTTDWSSSSVNVDYTLKFQCIDNTKTYSGSIDMNETYIKKDGKLWFNGQQA